MITYLASRTSFTFQVSYNSSSDTNVVNLLLIEKVATAALLLHPWFVTCKSVFYSIIQFGKEEWHEHESKKGGKG